jgi:hypothetical protein
MEFFYLDLADARTQLVSLLNDMAYIRPPLVRSRRPTFSQLPRVGYVSASL